MIRTTLRKDTISLTALHRWQTGEHVIKQPKTVPCLGYAWPRSHDRSLYMYSDIRRGTIVNVTTSPPSRSITFNISGKALWRLNMYYCQRHRPKIIDQLVFSSYRTLSYSYGTLSPVSRPKGRKCKPWHSGERQTNMRRPRTPAAGATASQYGVLSCSRPI